MKSLKAYLAPALAIASAGILALSLYGCASSPSGPIPPTVAVKITSIPDGGKVTINGQDVGNTPITVNIAVAADDTILYPISIRFASGIGSGKGAGQSRSNSNSKDYATGRRLPATLTITSNGMDESHDFAPRNPEGTKPSVDEAM